MKQWCNDNYDAKAVAKFFTENYSRVLIELGIALRDMGNSFAQPEATKKVLESVAHCNGLTFGDVHMLLRIAITGRTHGLGIYGTLSILGLDGACSRILYAALMCEQPVATIEEGCKKC